MPADELSGRRMHRRAVKWARHPPRAILLEREIGAAVDDPVAIMPLDRREARLESVGDAFCC